MLVRRDIEMVLEGFRMKSRLLTGLLEKIEQHRRDDLSQLQTARQDAWSQWDERLHRLEQWKTAALPLDQTAQALFGWRESVSWFERVQRVSRRYAETLTKKIERLEERSVLLADRIQQWLGRIVMKEEELNAFLSRQAEKPTEILVSSARKKPYLEFLYRERDEEGAISRELRAISSDTHRALERLAFAEAQVSKRADVNPAYFEICKNQVTDVWRPIERRLTLLSQHAANQDEPFTAGRQKLRATYEIVQKMRVVEVPSARPRPLLARLFNIEDN